jgi:hypothetical protein
MKQKALILLLPKERIAAVHWLRWTETETKLYGKVRTKEVACGQALDEAGFRNRTTQELHLITCRDCHAIAHDLPPPT